MDAKDIRLLEPKLDVFLEHFAECFGRRDTREHLSVYVRGQLSDLPQKSVEPIAVNAGVAPRTLQEFLSQLSWDHDKMRDRVQQLVVAQHAGPHRIGIFDETSDPKKGTKTPGVQKQWCGRLGKVENCMVTVHLAYAQDDFHCLVDGELFLPESWAEDRARCREAGIPDTMIHRPKWEIALELYDRALRNGLTFDWRVKDGDKGPIVWECKKVFLTVKDEQGLPAEKLHLLIARNVLHEGELKFYVSNAPPETSAGKLLLVALSRWRVERCFQDQKSEIGLDQYEGRRYVGLKRHWVLSMVSYLFLAQVRQEWGKNPDLTICQLHTAMTALIRSRWMADAPATDRWLEKVAKNITKTQQRNAEARTSHTKTTIGKLHSKGIYLTGSPPKLWNSEPAAQARVLVAAPLACAAGSHRATFHNFGGEPLNPDQPVLLEFNLAL